MLRNTAHMKMFGLLPFSIVCQQRQLSDCSQRKRCWDSHQNPYRRYISQKPRLSYSDLHFQFCGHAVHGDTRATVRLLNLCRLLLVNPSNGLYIYKATQTWYLQEFTGEMILRLQSYDRRTTIAAFANFSLINTQVPLQRQVFESVKGYPSFACLLHLMSI